MEASHSRSKKRPKDSTSGGRRQTRNAKTIDPEPESLLSSAMSAADDFNIRRSDLLLLPSQSLAPISPSSSSSPWFHNFLSLPPSISDPLWPRFFRMSKPTFSILLSLLSPSFPDPSAIPPHSFLAASLYRLAHAASFNSLARGFGLASPAIACRAFYTVCKLVNDKLGHLLDFETEISRIVVGFASISLPNCCGALGFGRFNVDTGLILGSNGYILVQALVDSEGRFLDISAGWPCTMKPHTILRQTKLFSRVEESGELLNGPSYKLSNGNSVPQYILGASCFPSLPWLITPYPRSSEDGDSFGGSSKAAFNAAHARAVLLVDTAFCRARSVWTLLSKTWKEDCLESLPFVVASACLLHNFLINCKEHLPVEAPDSSKEMEGLLEFEGAYDEAGMRLRDILAEHLSPGSSSVISSVLRKNQSENKLPPSFKGWKTVTFSLHIISNVYLQVEPLYIFKQQKQGLVQRARRQLVVLVLIR